MVKIIDDKRYNDSVLDRIRAVTEGDIADPYQKLWTAVFLRAVLDIANYTHSEEGRVAYKYMKGYRDWVNEWHQSRHLLKKADRVAVPARSVLATD